MGNEREGRVYDQRDAVCYRSQLVPGSKEYEIYYAAHPELKEKDDRVRVHYTESVAHQVRMKQFPEAKLAAAWVRGTKRASSYALRHAVDGPVSEDRLEVDPAEISWKIKELAKYLGAGIVGIGRLDQAWVYSHHAQHHAEEWGKPVELPHKYAIVMGFPQTWDLWLTGARADIPGYMDEWQFYHVMANTTVRLAAAIRDMGYPARAHIQSNYACLMPPLAVDAGLGEQCLIGLCLTKEYGLAYRLNAVTTGLPLVPDPPANLGIEDFCNRCNKCIEVCPSGALSRTEKVMVNGRRIWKQDVAQCFKYWNAKGVSCTICRRACPWSKPRTLPHKLVSTLAQRVTFSRPFLIRADDVIYGKKPRYYPPPRWLQDKEQKMGMGKRLLYFLDHL